MAKKNKVEILKSLQEAVLLANSQSGTDGYLYRPRGQRILGPAKEKLVTAASTPTQNLTQPQQNMLRSVGLVTTRMLGSSPLGEEAAQRLNDIKNALLPDTTSLESKVQKSILAVATHIKNDGEIYDSRGVKLRKRSRVKLLAAATVPCQDLSISQRSMLLGVGPVTTTGHLATPALAQHSGNTGNTGAGQKKENLKDRKKTRSKIAETALIKTEPDLEIASSTVPIVHSQLVGPLVGGTQTACNTDCRQQSTNVQPLSDAENQNLYHRHTSSILVATRYEKEILDGSGKGKVKDISGLQHTMNSGCNTACSKTGKPLNGNKNAAINEQQVENRQVGEIRLSAPAHAALAVDTVNSDKSPPQDHTGLPHKRKLLEEPARFHPFKRGRVWPGSEGEAEIEDMRAHERGGDTPLEQPMAEEIQGEVDILRAIEDYLEEQSQARSPQKRQVAQRPTPVINAATVGNGAGQLVFTMENMTWTMDITTGTMLISGDSKLSLRFIASKPRDD